MASFLLHIPRYFSIVGLTVTISSIDGVTGWFQAQAKSKTRQNVPATGSTIFPQGAAASIAPDPVKEFTDYMNQTPAQRMQSAWLKQHGVSQEEFDAMSAADKQKLIDEMKRELQQKMEDKAKADAKTDILV